MKDTLNTEMGDIYISSEQIIHEVQKYKCLYDPSDPEHKDRDVMKDAWLSVTAAVVGEPWDSLNSAEKNEAVKEAQRRWRNIRDSMRKSLNISGKGPRRPYMFHKKLTFLLEVDHFRNLSDTEDTAAAHGADEKTKKSSSHTVRTSRRKKNSRVIDNLDDTSAAHDADELSEISDSQPSTRNPRPKRKKHKPRQIIQTAQKDNSFERELSVFVPHNACMPEVNNFSGVNHPCCQNTCMAEPENPDRLFLLSLLPRVSALGSRNKLDFQIKAMQMLQKYDKGDSNS